MTINYTPKRRKYIIPALILMLYTALLFNTQTAVRGIADAIKLCTNILIPSIFPFTVATDMLMTCGIGEYLSHFIKRPFERLFHISSGLALPYLIGILSGYPQGSLAILSVYEKGGCTKDEAEHALCFCNNTGVAFIFGAVPAMTGDKTIGIKLFLIQFFISFVFAVMTRPKKIRESGKNCITTNTQTSPSLCRSVVKAVYPMALICSYVLFFGFITHLFTESSLSAALSPELNGAFLSMLELSNASSFIADIESPLKYPLISFATVFSGFCVHLQITGCIDKRLSARKLLFSKLFQGIAAFLIMLFCKSS